MAEVYVAPRRPNAHSSSCEYLEERRSPKPKIFSLHSCQFIPWIHGVLYVDSTNPNFNFSTDNRTFSDVPYLWYNTVQYRTSSMPAIIAMYGTYHTYFPFRMPLTE